MTNLKNLYSNKINIMKFFRENNKNEFNTTNSILVSYDLQAGSYNGYFKSNQQDDNYHINSKRVTMCRQDYIKQFCQYVAQEIDNFEYKSILEAGVGEATSFTHILKSLSNQNCEPYGFDISPSRIKQGIKFLEENKIDNAKLIVADILNTPFQSNSFDVVYTVHAIEPNTNTLNAILKELYRITNKYLILIEPSYELGNEETKTNINNHKYIKELKATTQKLGYKILKYELAPIGTYSNQPAIMIIEKKEKREHTTIQYCCPICKKNLHYDFKNYYCKKCYLLFPIVDNIPLLYEKNSILFTQYLD